MDFVTSIRLDASEMERILGQLRYNEEQVVTRAALEIEGGAKINAAVDTGAMRASIYTTTAARDGFADAEAAAQSANPEAETAPIPQPGAGEEVIARVGPSVEYAVYVELGTSRMAAQPFLGPAAEAEQQKFTSGETWKELFE